MTTLVTMADGSRYAVSGGAREAYHFMRRMRRAFVQEGCPTRQLATIDNRRVVVGPGLSACTATSPVTSTVVVYGAAIRGWVALEVAARTHRSIP